MKTHQKIRLLAFYCGVDIVNALIDIQLFLHQDKRLVARRDLKEVGAVEQEPDKR